MLSIFKCWPWKVFLRRVFWWHKDPCKQILPLRGTYIRTLYLLYVHEVMTHFIEQVTIQNGSRLLGQYVLAMRLFLRFTFRVSFGVIRSHNIRNAPFLYTPKSIRPLCFYFLWIDMFLCDISAFSGINDLALLIESEREREKHPMYIYKHTV